MALAAPSLAAVLSFLFWTQKRRVQAEKELLSNFNKVENCVIELTTEVRQIQRFNEHLHDCIHEMKTRINNMDDRFYNHVTKQNDESCN